MKYVDSVLMNNEEVVENAHVTKLCLIGVWIKGILLCFLLFIPTLKAIKKTIEIAKIELALTNQRVVGRTGIVSRNVMDTYLDKVQTVKINESFFGRLFHYAEVVISTAGDDYHFYAIKNANEFKKKVMKQIDAYSDAKITKQAKALAGAMKD